MAEANPAQPASQPPAPEAPGSSENVATIVYVLYLAALLTGVTALVGAVVAYVYRNDAPEWLQTHYNFQIRTFWLGLLFGVVGLLLSIVAVGFVVFAFLAVWLAVRCVKGLKFVSRRQAYPDPLGWWF